MNARMFYLLLAILISSASHSAPVPKEAELPDVKTEDQRTIQLQQTVTVKMPDGKTKDFDLPAKKFTFERLKQEVDFAPGKKDHLFWFQNYTFSAEAKRKYTSDGENPIHWVRISFDGHPNYLNTTPRITLVLPINSFRRLRKMEWLTLVIPQKLGMEFKDTNKKVVGEIVSARLRIGFLNEALEWGPDLGRAVLDDKLSCSWKQRFSIDDGEEHGPPQDQVTPPAFTLADWQQHQLTFDEGALEEKRLAKAVTVRKNGCLFIAHSDERGNLALALYGRKEPKTKLTAIASVEFPSSVVGIFRGKDAFSFTVNQNLAEVTESTVDFGTR